MSVIIYSKIDCPWCVKAKKLLTDNGYEYNEIIISKTDRKDFDSVCNGARTVPQILIDGVLIGGHDDLVRYLNAD